MDPTVSLKALADLRDAGVITENEYQLKASVLLARIESMTNAPIESPVEAETRRDPPIPTPPNDTTPSPATSTRPRTLALVGIVAAGALVLWAFVAGPLASHTLSGDITVADTEVSEFLDPSVITSATGGFCTTSGGYSDIAFGTAVVVKDAKGEIIATGALGIGETTGSRICQFPLTVKGIPNSDFYSVEVSHRGALSYSIDELESEDWTLHLSLGD
jgi:hypothetical protein